jgi:hypothetical protein
MPTATKTPEQIRAYSEIRRQEKLLRRLHAKNPQQGPQTDDELWAYVAHTWGVQIPRLQVCPNHVSPFKAFADAYFARQSMIVWHASRGLAGKSYTLSLLGLTEAVTLKCSVNILGGSGEQSKNVHTYMADAWAKPGAPASMLASDPMQMETRLSEGQKIRALLASQTSVRGPHIPRLRIDEADSMTIKLFDAAMGQTMEQGGVKAQTVISSTWQEPEGCFTEVLRRATDRGWPVYQWCYKETQQPHGWLSPDEIERKRLEVTQVMWDVEYNLGEPSPENRAIMPEAVNAMFQEALGVYEGAPRQYIEAEAPQAGAMYAHGADWAKSQDWTEIITLRIDCEPARLVAYERLQRLPWPQMVERLDARQRRYGVGQSRAAHDGTGLGDVVDGYLSERATAVILVGRTRADLFSNYINAIEKGQVVSPKIKALEGQHRYATVDDVYGSGHPPDGFVAGAMAWHAKSLKPRWTFAPVRA